MRIRIPNTASRIAYPDTVHFCRIRSLSWGRRNGFGMWTKKMVFSKTRSESHWKHELREQKHFHPNVYTLFRPFFVSVLQNVFVRALVYRLFTEPFTHSGPFLIFCATGLSSWFGNPTYGKVQFIVLSLGCIPYLTEFVYKEIACILNLPTVVPYFFWQLTVPELPVSYEKEHQKSAEMQ